MLKVKTPIYAIKAKAKKTSPFFKFGIAKCVMESKCGGSGRIESRVGDSNFKVIIYPNRNFTRLRMINNSSNYSNVYMTVPLPTEITLGDKLSFANGKTVDLEVYEIDSQEFDESPECRTNSLAKIDYKEI